MMMLNKYDLNCYLYYCLLLLSDNEVEDREKVEQKAQLLAAVDLLAPMNSAVNLSDQRVLAAIFDGVSDTTTID